MLKRVRRRPVTATRFYRETQAATSGPKPLRRFGSLHLRVGRGWDAACLLRVQRERHKGSREVSAAQRQRPRFDRCKRDCLRRHDRRLRRGGGRSLGTRLGVEEGHHLDGGRRSCRVQRSGIRPRGTLYAATAGPSSSVVSLDPATLKQTGRYAANGVKFTSSPVVIDYQESDLLAVASNDGRINLLNGESLGETQAYRSPVYSVADFASGTLSTWRDEGGATWVLAPSGGTAASSVNFPVTNGTLSNGSITAWKVVDKDGEPALEPGWVSRDMVSPLPPIVVNGVVFAVASGEFRGSDSSIGAAERVQRSSPAVLYALDGATGKVLWESGDSIASFAHGMAMSAGGGYVYLVTHDGTLHSFGFAMEH